MKIWMHAVLYISITGEEVVDQVLSATIGNVIQVSQKQYKWKDCICIYTSARSGHIQLFLASSRHFVCSVLDLVQDIGISRLMVLLPRDETVSSL